MIAILLCLASLVAGIFYPGVLIAGCLFTYQAASLSGMDGLTIAYSGAAAVISIGHFLKNKPKISLNFLDASFLIFILVVMSTTLYAVDNASAVAMDIKLAMSAFTMYVVGRLIVVSTPSRTLAPQIITGALIFGAAFSLVIYQHASAEYWSRLKVGAGSAVGLAQPLPYVLVCAVLAIVSTIGSRKYFLALGAFVAGAVVLYISILSGTRGIFIAAAAGVAVVGFVGWRQARWGRLIGLGVVALVVLVAVAPRVEATKRLTYGIDRLIGNFGSSGVVVDSSAQQRINKQHAALDLIDQKTRLGTGIGGYDYLTHEEYPHNLFLEVATETGLLGLFFLLIYLWALFRRQALAAMIDPPLGLTMLALTTTAFVHQQLSFALYMAKPLFLLTGLTAGAMGAFAVRRSRQTPPAPPRRRRVASPKPVDATHPEA